MQSKFQLRSINLLGMEHVCTSSFYCIQCENRRILVDNRFVWKLKSAQSDGLMLRRSNRLTPFILWPGSRLHELDKRWTCMISKRKKQFENVNIIYLCWERQQSYLSAMRTSTWQDYEVFAERKKKSTISKNTY